MKALEISEMENLEGGICGVVAGGGVATGAVGYVAAGAKLGARFGWRLGLKGLVFGIAVGAAAGGMCAIIEAYD